ncbi:hypothetical protein VP01_5416g1 [Puccinia sorghi]|uniref:Uncharacterized protein n=1 Tax=Puccinia sorghi TaxID=27349 RepID=A0A0L6UJQ9_9BASI|nr:hypothetical protein VP01_5416g1 [Puccinia sorghi]
MENIACVIQCTHIVNSSFIKIINWKTLMDIYQKYNNTSVKNFKDLAIHPNHHSALNILDQLKLKGPLGEVVEFTIQKLEVTNSLAKLFLNEEKDDTALTRGRAVIVDELLYNRLLDFFLKVTSSSLPPLGASSPTRLFDPAARINFSIVCCSSRYMGILDTVLFMNLCTSIYQLIRRILYFKLGESKINFAKAWGEGYQYFFICYIRRMPKQYIIEKKRGSILLLGFWTSSLG